MSRPFRYTFILVLVALGTCLAAVSGWRYARASAPVNGPIVLVSIDALRADRLPIYGYRAGHTPAIDNLASDGIVFERAYSHVPQTLPAHAALLTGRLPFENGVRDGVGFTLNPNERLLAEMLRDRGYATAGVVSSYLLRKDTGIAQGFGLFDTIAEQPDAEPPLVRDGAESEGVAERWFDAAGTTRAFLFLHLAEPAIDQPPVDGGAPLSYDARVSKADEIVGRLVRYLKAHQLYDQSTVILLADHGAGLGDHGEEGHGLLLYDETLRVPLIVKQAAGAGAGRRVATPVQHIDIVPTILDLAKAPVPGNLRGRSLAPLFEARGRFDDRVFYAESLFGRYHFGGSSLTSVSDGRYRYTSGSSPELYDLEADPSSRTNLAERLPDVVARFQRALADLEPAPQVAPMDAVTPQDRDRLERLGYVGVVSEPGATPAASDAAIDVTMVEQYRAAVRLFTAGRWLEAIDAFRRLSAAEPASPDAWLHLARAASRAERHDVAADALQHVIDLTPASAGGYVALADTFLRLHRYNDARNKAQQIVDGAIGPPATQAIAHELLARAALGFRNYQVARLEAGRAEEADASRPVVAYVNGRIAAEQRRYAEALEEFEGALALVDSGKAQPLADLQLYTAEALLRAERLAEAEYLFLRQLKETPLSPRALTGLTSIYKATGRSDEASSLAQHH